MADDDAGKIFAGIFIVIVGLVALAACVVAAMATFSVGAVFGGIVSTGNYFQSFMKNVRPETDPTGIVAKWVVGFVFVAMTAIAIALTAQFYRQ